MTSNVSSEFNQDRPNYRVHAREKLIGLPVAFVVIKTGGCAMLPSLRSIYSPLARLSSAPCRNWRNNVCRENQQRRFLCTLRNSVKIGLVIGFMHARNYVLNLSEIIIWPFSRGRCITFVGLSVRLTVSAVRYHNTVQILQKASSLIFQFYR